MRTIAHHLPTTPLATTHALLSPDQLSLAELVRGCRDEMRQYLCQQLVSDRCGFELFQRAFQQDEWAWASIYELYYGLVLTWITQQKGGSSLNQDDYPAIVNATFARFAKAVTQGATVFHSVAGILQYLKCCAQCATIEEIRSRQAHQCEETLASLELDREPLANDPADIVASRVMAQEVWHAIEATLHNRREQIVATCLLLQGRPPRDIYRTYPEEFASVKEVYNVRRNMLDRLQHNRQLLALVAERAGEASIVCQKSKRKVPKAAVEVWQHD